MIAPALTRTRETFNIEKDGLARLFPFLLALPLLYDSLIMFFHLAQITVYPGIGAFYTAMNVGLFMAAVINWRIRLSPIALLVNALFIALLAHGMLVGLLRQNDFGKPFFGQLYHWTVMFFGFNLGYHVLFTPHRIEVLLKTFSRYIVVGAAAGFLAIEAYRIRSQGAVYAGYPAEQLLLPLSIFGRWRHWTMIVITFCLIFVTGKRGPLAAAIGILAYLALQQNTQKPLKAFAQVIALAFLVLSGIFAVRYAARHAILAEESSIGRIIRKWDKTFVYSKEGLEAVGDERKIEVDGALQWLDSAGKWLWGQGFGWSVTVPGDIDVIRQTLHFTYLDYVLSFGLVWALPLFLFLGGLMVFIWRVGARCSGSQDADAQALIVTLGTVIFGYLILSLACSIIEISVLFWIFVGMATQLAETQAGKSPRGAA